MKRPPDNVINDQRKRKCVNNSECERSSALEEGEFGVIESVTVQNFMCHENLTLSFEPHMNFIIGQNGSGKSAILTAIILALGGKSSSTDRFSNIKGFVKSGKNKAKVEVVLRNGGEGAYKQEVYGEKIVVVREFNKEGTSNYKIKSESGTICSNQKSELTNILEQMGIMGKDRLLNVRNDFYKINHHYEFAMLIENVLALLCLNISLSKVECPVCVLTQATSKRFLISKDAKAERLFEFFYKGTGLEMLEDKYKSMTISREEAEADLDKKKQSLPDLKKDLRKWKKFLDSSKRISDYKNELIWANVIEMEKKVQEREEAHREMEDEFNMHKSDLEGCKKSFAEKSSELDEYNKQKSELVSEMENNRKKLEELNSEYEVLISSQRKSRGTLQRLKNEKTKLEEDITGLEKCINEEMRRDQRNLEEENKKRQNTIQNLKNELTCLDEKYTTLNETINTTMSEQSNFGKVIENLRVEVNQHRYELQSIENNLNATKNAIKSKVNAFGEHTEKVLLEIRKMQQNFRKLPVGPIGMYLEVKDPKWATAVEFAISGGLLNSFCVDNHQDSQLLRNILRKYYQKPPAIIVSQYESQMFDVQHGRVQSDFPSVLDMLIIKNHLVANCLIDQALIEKKVLVEDEMAGASLMRNPPKNCHSAYFLNCDQICFNPSRLYSYGKRTSRSRLSAIRAEDVKNLEREREEKIAKIEEFRRQIQTMEKARESLPGKIEKLQREAVKIYTQKNANGMEIKELQRKEETKDVNCLQEDLQPLYHSYEQKKEEIEQQSHVLSELESKRLDFKRRIDTLSAQLKSLDQNFQKLLMQISLVSKLKENFASGKRKFELELKCKENRCKMDRKELDDLQSKLDMICARAESTCPRINTEKSPDDISRLIKETERVVEAQSNCDGEDLVKKYKEKLENLHRAERELKRIENFLIRIGEMLKVRNANFQKIRKNTELLIGLTFTTILSGNGYTGHLIFDQTKRSLTMDVSTRASDRTRKNHSSLSGGERSFVTIAFLLALWERTKMPFRVLDEYDVFMDSSNRQLSVDLLCKKAVEMSKTQFIFLSPLELTRMPELGCIHILKLAPPKRKGEDDENSPRKKRS